MRHQQVNRKFGREQSVRRAFFRSLMRALIMEGRIQTTEPRAKEIRPMVEKLLTVAKTSNEVSAIRLITARMGGQKDVAFKLVKDVAPKYKDRQGGYTRVLKLPPRISDGAAMALVEFV